MAAFLLLLGGIIFAFVSPTISTPQKGPVLSSGNSSAGSDSEMVRRLECNKCPTINYDSETSAGDAPTTNETSLRVVFQVTADRTAIQLYNRTIYPIPTPKPGLYVWQIPSSLKEEEFVAESDQSRRGVFVPIQYTLEKRHSDYSTTSHFYQNRLNFQILAIGHEAAPVYVDRLQINIHANTTGEIDSYDIVSVSITRSVDEHTPPLENDWNCPGMLANVLCKPIAYAREALNPKRVFRQPGSGGVLRLYLLYFFLPVIAGLSLGIVIHLISEAPSSLVGRLREKYGSRGGPHAESVTSFPKAPSSSSNTVGVEKTRPSPYSGSQKIGLRH